MCTDVSVARIDMKLTIASEHALILLSDNGKEDLSNLQFDNFFARSYDKAGVIWYTASIVVTAPGDFRIRHSVVATRAGTSKTAAFQLLMLDVETRLDDVLRGNGVNATPLPIKQSSKRSGAVSAVSIIATPSQAMAPPKLEDAVTESWSGAPEQKTWSVAPSMATWSGEPLSTSPKSPKSPKQKPTTEIRHVSKSSQGTQDSFGSSKYSWQTRSTQTPSPTNTIGSVSSKGSVSSAASSTPRQLHSARLAKHASQPLQTAKSDTAVTRSRLAKYASQPLQPSRSEHGSVASSSSPRRPNHVTQIMQSTTDSGPSSAPNTPTITKTQPLPRSSMDKSHIAEEPEQLHPALRSSNSTSSTNSASTYASTASKGPSNGGLRPKPSSIAGSSVYSRPSRSPVSPMNELEEVKPPSPLHVEKEVNTSAPSHFDKPDIAELADMPERYSMKPQTEFEIYA